MTTTGTPPLSDADRITMKLDEQALTITHLSAQLAAVTEALKPFAECADDDGEASDDETSAAEFTLGDFRNAKRVLDNPATSASSWIAEREALRADLEGARSAALLWMEAARRAEAKLAALEAAK